MAQTSQMPIDTHAHLVPPTLVEEARKSGKSLGVRVEDTPQGAALQFEGLVPLRPPSGNLAKLEPRLEWMDKQGISTQFVASWLDIQGYTLKPESAATWARLLNEHLVEDAAAFHKDRFRTLATVPVQDGELAARELDYAVNKLGMLGVMLAADPIGQDIAKESFEPFWAAADHLGVPVVLHPPTHGFGATIKPAYLSTSLGRTIDTTVTAAKLILGGLLDRYSHLKLVLVHGGGFLPWQMARIDNNYKRGMSGPKELKREGPTDYLPLLYYDTVTMSPPAIRMLRDVAGADHIMLGSDFVFSGAEEPLMEPVEHAGLRPAEVASISYKTAQQLFLPTFLE